MNWKLKQFTELRYDDNTNIDGTPITVYVGKDSKTLDFKKGTVGVTEKDKVPSIAGSTYNTVHFIKPATNIAALINSIQFFGLLQLDTKGYKITQNVNETKETSVLFYGGRNVDVHPDMVAHNVSIGAQMYLYPHLMDKQPTGLGNMYEFLAVDEARLVALAAKDGITLTDELRARLYLGRADMGKVDKYLNVPIAIAPAAY
jgi:hypothetical protein